MFFQTDIAIENRWSATNVIYAVLLVNSVEVNMKKLFFTNIKNKLSIPIQEY